MGIWGKGRGREWRTERDRARDPNSKRREKKEEEEERREGRLGNHSGVVGWDSQGLE